MQTLWRKDALIYMPKKKKKQGSKKEDEGPKYGYVQGFPYPINLSMNDHVWLRTIRLEQDYKWGGVQENHPLTVEGVRITSVPYYTDPQDTHVINVCTIRQSGETDFTKINRYNALINQGTPPNVFGKCFVFDVDNAIAYDISLSSGTIYSIAPIWDSMGYITYRDINTILNIAGSPQSFYALEDFNVYRYLPGNLENIESSGLGNFARSHVQTPYSSDYACITFVSDRTYTDGEISDIAWACHSYYGDNYIDFTIQQYTI